MSDSEVAETQLNLSAGGTTQQATVTVINRHLNITPFQVTRDSNDTAVRWAKWKQNIERQFRFFGIKEPQLKKEFIYKLDQYFLPKKNKDYARFKLGNLVQQDEEPMATYYARIRDIAKKCSYTDEKDAIRDHLIKTMRNNAIRVKAIHNNLDTASNSRRSSNHGTSSTTSQRGNKSSKQRNRIKE